MLLFLGFCLIVPMAVSLYRHDHHLNAFLFSDGLVLILGLIASRSRPGSQFLSLRSGILLIVLSWLAFGLLGALPYYFGHVLSFTDSLFESISGFTTTGSSVLTEIESQDISILFWRSMTHWIGGVVIIVFSLAIYPYLGASGVRLLKLEVPRHDQSKFLPRFYDSAKALMKVYLTLTILFSVLLHAAGMCWMDSVSHTFGGLATGGFSTRNLGIGDYNSSLIDWLVTLLSFVGGVNFYLLYQLFLKGGIHNIWKNPEFKLYVLLLVLCSLLAGWALYSHGLYGFSDSLRYGFFHVVTMGTTTGYTNQNYDLWPGSIHALLILVMLIGGCAGSTSGSLKVNRLLILIGLAFMEIKKVLHPNGVFFVKIRRHVVEIEEAISVFGFLCLFIFTICASSLALGAMHLGGRSALSASIAAITGTGPGLRMVGPYANFAQVPLLGKYVLMFTMLAGRMELLIFFTVFRRKFWTK